ncbi:MAG: FKBP-type peptidyl-prolyl cis-trans isomerase [Fibrobacterales bacterium]
MKKLIASASVLMMLVGCQKGIDTKSVTKASLKTEMDKVSYSIGLDIGSNFKKQEIEVELTKFFRGIEDGLTATETPLMDQKEVRETMTSFQKVMMEKMQDKRKKETEDRKLQGEKNIEENKKFFEENKAKEGVKTTESGLQFKVITEGTGPIPTLDDKVECHYKGTLLNGEVFDSSYERGKPSQFPLKGVIKGWTEALQMMKVGSKWELYITPELGYGTRGSGKISPNAALKFEIELLSIVPKTEAPKKADKK